MLQSASDLRYQAIGHFRPPFDAPLELHLSSTTMMRSRYGRRVRQCDCEISLIIVGRRSSIRTGAITHDGYVLTQGTNDDCIAAVDLRRAFRLVMRPLRQNNRVTQ